MDREVWTKVWTQLKQPLCFMNGVSIKAKDFLEPASGGHQWYCTFHTGFNTYSVWLLPENQTMQLVHIDYSRYTYFCIRS